MKKYRARLALHFRIAAIRLLGAASALSVFSSAQANTPAIGRNCGGLQCLASRFSMRIADYRVEVAPNARIASRRASQRWKQYIVSTCSGFFPGHAGGAVLYYADFTPIQRR